MNLRKHKHFITFFLMLNLSSCATWIANKPLGQPLHPNEKLKLSLSFLSPSNMRIEEAAAHKKLIKEIKARYPNITIETEYDDLRSKNNYSVFVKNEQRTMLDGETRKLFIFFLIFPIPIQKTVSIDWRITDTDGHIHKLSRSYSYNEFAFIPFLPIGLYQSFRNPVAERFLAENLSILEEFINDRNNKKSYEGRP